MCTWFLISNSKERNFEQSEFHSLRLRHRGHRAKCKATLNSRASQLGFGRSGVFWSDCVLLYLCPSVCCSWMSWQESWLPKSKDESNYSSGTTTSVAPSMRTRLTFAQMLIVIYAMPLQVSIVAWIILRMYNFWWSYFAKCYPLYSSINLLRIVNST